MTLRHLFIERGNWIATLQTGEGAITAPTAFFSSVSREDVLAELRRIGRVTIPESFK